MLQYRKIDFQNDVKEIVELLKTSLSDRHTEEFFLWKHFHNPYGKSYGLLACDEGKIIGVRMFMFWEFVKKGEIVRAIRPVDTITHPDYRGKGIFKKLTFKGLEDCKNDYDLIFNTPNKNSLPGYLKMGWKEFKTSQVYFLGLNLPFGKHSGKILNVHDIKEDLPSSNEDTWVTNKSIDFIKWRYSDEYYRAFKFTSNCNSLVIFKLIVMKGFRTIVICDYLGKKSNMHLAVKSLCKKEKVLFCYYLGTHLKGNSFLLNLKRDKSVVVFKDDAPNISDKIRFSLGDLESIM